MVGKGCLETEPLAWREVPVEREEKVVNRLLNFIDDFMVISWHYDTVKGVLSIVCGLHTKQ